MVHHQRGLFLPLPIAALQPSNRMLADNLGNLAPHVDFTRPVARRSFARVVGRIFPVLRNGKRGKENGSNRGDAKHDNTVSERFKKRKREFIGIAGGRWKPEAIEIFAPQLSFASTR